jgi:copper resistance protein B
VLCALLTNGAIAAAVEMDHASHASHGMDEDPFITMLLVDRLEAGREAGTVSGGWDAKLWWGTDHNRWQLRSEGHDAAAGHSADTTLEASWLQPVSPWMQRAVGVVRDVRGSDVRSGISAGLSGLLPYRIALQSAVWVVEGGQAALRLELEQDWLLTQRWTVQPRLESRLWTDGQRSVDVGLRLRYEIRREVAPYVGVTRVMSREAGQASSSDTRVLAGLRFWF